MVDRKISPILKFWSSFYAALPKLYVPGTKFDIALVILSTIFMTSLRIINGWVYANLHGFDPSNYRFVEITASTTSTMHSLILVPSLWAVLRDQPYKPSASIASAPQYYKDSVTALLSFCTGYMVYDFIFLFKINNWSLHPDDWAFAMHHIVTSLYMSQCRVLEAGHISAMALMWSGEFSNPLQNGHAVTKFAMQMTEDDTLWHAIHPYLEFAFAVVYFIFRAFVGPSQIVHISYDLLTKEGRKNIPLYISIAWIIMIWGIILGSIPWTIECYEMAMDGMEVKYDKHYDYGPRYEI